MPPIGPRDAPPPQPPRPAPAGPEPQRDRHARASRRPPRPPPGGDARARHPRLPLHQSREHPIRDRNRHHGVWTAITLPAMRPRRRPRAHPFRIQDWIRVSQKLRPRRRSRHLMAIRRHPRPRPRAPLRQVRQGAMEEFGCAGAPLAVDKVDGFGFQALTELGIRVTDPSPATLDAREIKTPEEVQLMNLNGAIAIRCSPNSRPRSVPACASKSCSPCCPHAPSPAR